MKKPAVQGGERQQRERRIAALSIWLGLAGCILLTTKFAILGADSALSLALSFATPLLLLAASPLARRHATAAGTVVVFAILWGLSYTAYLEGVTNTAALALSPFVTIFAAINMPKRCIMPIGFGTTAVVGLAHLLYRFGVHGPNVGDVDHLTAVRFGLTLVILNLFITFIIAGFVATLRQRAAEAKLAQERADLASKAKTQFLSTLCHELRTPLNGVLGMSDILGRTALDARQVQAVDAIKASGEALRVTVENLLELTEVEPARTVDAAEFSLPLMARECVEVLETDAWSKGLGLGLEIGDDVPERALGDRARIARILVSLLDNAVKFTDEGAVSLRIARDGDDDVIFRVDDTGPGVPPELREQIFDPFTQVDQSETRAHGGLGVGLAVCAHLAKAIGAEIAYAPLDEGGSRFELRAPLVFTAAEAAPAEAEAPRRARVA